MSAAFIITAIVMAMMMAMVTMAMAVELLLWQQPSSLREPDFPRVHIEVGVVPAHEEIAEDGVPGGRGAQGSGCMVIVIVIRSVGSGFTREHR